jgi:hypothetical protein
MMEPIDPMAIAIDWLDAYRAQALEQLIGLYDDHATHMCGCDGQKFIVGKQALRAYWIERFRTHPAFALDDLQPDGDAVSLSYLTRDGVVRASLLFAGAKIAHVICGPAVANVSHLGARPPLAPR